MQFLTTFTQLTARLKNFLRGWLLAFGIKKSLVECATVCVKSEVILNEGYALPYFQCENCDFYSNKFSDTKEHLKQEHEIDDYNPYRCSHCEYVTPELSRFAYHIQRFFKK